MAKLSSKHLSTVLLLTITLFALYSSHTNNNTNPTSPNSLHQPINNQDDPTCHGIHQNSQTRAQKCSYVKSNQGCKPRGHIPYLQFFYCTFTPSLGYLSLSLWLLVLFYLLGDTASNYFCHSLSGLSKTLTLSPTIAGLTLLSLGNGAPDIFSSIIAFLGNGTVDIGLNSTLGAALFVLCIVFGIISICVDKSHVKISRKSFFTNALFFLLSLSCLAVCITVRHIGPWAGVSFLALYVLYVLFSFMKIGGDCYDESFDLNAPLICQVDIDQVPDLSEDLNAKEDGKVSKCLDRIMFMLELPLDLPRRLTIPVVSAEKWSKPYAVVSASVTPIFLTYVSCNFNGVESRVLANSIGGLIGVSFGILLYCTSDRFNPPRKCIKLWLLLGFVMSIAWTYFLAQELVSLLVSLSLILGISQSLIGLTVLAWGNSVGDLVANVAMSKNGGPDGVHVAASGCFAGPLFNILVGLGLSLGAAAWKAYPRFYAISVEDSVFVTMGFLVLALFWAFVVLLKGRWRIGKSLGYGLIAIYLCFLFVQIVVGFGHMVGFHVPNL